MGDEFDVDALLEEPFNQKVSKELVFHFKLSIILGLSIITSHLFFVTQFTIGNIIDPFYDVTLLIDEMWCTPIGLPKCHVTF